MKYLFFLIGLFLSFSANATHVDCGLTTISTLYVVGDRSDGTANRNMLIVALPSGCLTGVTNGFVRNDDPSY